MSETGQAWLQSKPSYYESGGAERLVDFYSPQNAKVGNQYASNSTRVRATPTREANDSRIANMSAQTSRDARDFVDAQSNEASVSWRSRMVNWTGQFRMSPMVGFNDASSSKSFKLAKITTRAILSHPFIILKRLCQVSSSSCYHISPTSVLTSTFKLVRHQGLRCLSKGILTSVALQGSAILVESTLIELSNNQTDSSNRDSTERFMRLFLLKLASGAVLLPLYACHVTECVQSDVLAERASISDLLRETLERALTLVPGVRVRAFPLWKLLVPVCVLYASHSLLRRAIQQAMGRKRKRSKSVPSAPYIPASPIEIQDSPDEFSGSAIPESEEHEAALLEGFYAELFAAFAADSVLYAGELIVNRLCVQGTRTLIDDLTTGVNVQPVTFHYDSVPDAIRSVLSQDGIAGFYRGFGAVLLQFALQLAVVKLGYFAAEHLAQIYATPRGRRSRHVTPLRQGLQKYKLPPRRDLEDD